jgi:hypothetical protein
MFTVMRCHLCGYLVHGCPVYVLLRIWEYHVTLEVLCIIYFRNPVSRTHNSVMDPYKDRLSFLLLPVTNYTNICCKKLINVTIRITEGDDVYKIIRSVVSKMREV